MRFWTIPLMAVAVVALLSSLHAFQLPFREYPAIEYNNFPLPPDYQQTTEFVFARLMYPPAPTARFDRTRGGRRGRGGFGRGGVSDWSGGNSSWTQDYPRADRHFLAALRRLTRIDARSVEQPVNLNDEDDVFNWPFLYAVRPGEWELTDSQAKKFHDFLDRGGFFMTDDFWGSFEWGVFMQSMSKVQPDRQPVDIPEDDPIFHSIYDLKDRYQIPGAWGLYGRGFQNDGNTPYWRAIYDDKHRIICAITPNSDMGDSWEFADAPEYPEKYSALGIRIGVNYIVYAMTH